MTSEKYFFLNPKGLSFQSKLGLKSVFGAFRPIALQIQVTLPQTFIVFFMPNACMGHNPSEPLTAVPKHCEATPHPI